MDDRDHPHVEGLSTVTPSELDELKSRPGNSCAEVAGRLGVHLRRHGREMVGPCPICSTDPNSRTALRWQTKASGWVCAVCQEGGDVIKLVQLVLNYDFRRAVEWLGGARALDPAEEQARSRARDAAEKKKADQAQAYRDREVRSLWGVYSRASDPRGTVVQEYLANRGVPVPDWPEGAARLRHVSDMAYAHGTVTDDAGRRSAKVIHRGPAMLAPITRQSKFCGLHVTWLAAGGTKLRICDPETGAALPAKKVRGSKTGGVIELITRVNPKRIIMGEGIETVLTVWHAMRSCDLDLSEVAFWSSVDLGNLGGKASAAVVHPDLMTASGRRRRVPGPDPDLSAEGITVPDSVTEVTILGDGDSDWVTTRCAVNRGAERLKAARTERVVKAAWALQGLDFNDMLLRGI